MGAQVLRYAHLRSPSSSTDNNGSVVLVGLVAQIRNYRRNKTRFHFVVDVIGEDVLGHTRCSRRSNDVTMDIILGTFDSNCSRQPDQPHFSSSMQNNPIIKNQITQILV